MSLETREVLNLPGLKRCRELVQPTFIMALRLCRVVISLKCPTEGRTRGRQQMSRTHVRAIVSTNLLAVALVWLQAARGQVADQRLPAKVEQLIRDAIESQPPSRERPDLREANLTALGKLKSAPWPDVKSLQRVRIITKGEQP